ncbi:MAG: hypothetical protein Q9184_004525, partial [Pyrenodesmia sp. 2 TL-2023]
MLVRRLKASNSRRSIADLHTSFRQNWSGTKDLKLFGLDELVKKDSKWGIDVKRFLVASNDHYRNVGLGGTKYLPTVEEVFEDKVTSTSGSFLPVCDSFMPDNAPSQDHIPCMCGDENGSKTLAFWKETHFDSWVGAQDKFGPYEPHYLCQRDMQQYRVPPVPYYLSLCNMNAHW